MAKQNLVVISDAGRDIDDEMTFVAIVAAIRMGLVDLKAVVANLHDAKERARLIKGMLTELGAPDIPVGVGQRVNTKMKYSHLETLAAYKAHEGSVAPNGYSLLHKTFLEAKDNSITLLLISGMTDADIFLSHHPELAKRKLAKVVIMGGVYAKDGVLQTDENGHLIPDFSYNNYVDPQAANFLYKKLQELEIPTTIVSRHAVYKAEISHTIFDEIMGSGSLVAKRINKRHQEYIADFWRIVNLPDGHEDRKDFPPRMNVEWFVKKFTSGTQEIYEDLKSGRPVHECVERATLYDTITLMAALDGNRHLFTPRRHGSMSIIGVSGSEPNIADLGGLTDKMKELIFKGLEPAKNRGMARDIGLN